VSRAEAGPIAIPIVNAATTYLFIFILSCDAHFAH
jgi:hypothetical protein